MSNHYHVVLHINYEQALSWSELEVIEHWNRLFKGSLISQRFYQGKVKNKSEFDRVFANKLSVADGWLVAERSDAPVPMLCHPVKKGGQALAGIRTGPS